MVEHLYQMYFFTGRMGILQGQCPLKITPLSNYFITGGLLLLIELLAENIVFYIAMDYLFGKISLSVL